MDLLAAALVAALALLVEHWFPWELLIRRPLPPLAAYTLGVLALALPLTGLFLIRGEDGAALALWTVIGSGGAAVLCAHALDRFLLGLNRKDELIEQLKLKDGDQER